MSRLNTYLAVLLAVALLALPLRQANAVVDQPQGCCCSDMGNEGCCSNPIEELPDNSGQTDDDCTCNMSPLPFLPDEPFEMLTGRVDYHPDKTKIAPECSFNKFSTVFQRAGVMNNSPPPGEFVPSFIQYSVLLI
jgi:hypothetical protein